MQLRKRRRKSTSSKQTSPNFNEQKLKETQLKEAAQDFLFFSLTIAEDALNMLKKKGHTKKEEEEILAKNRPVSKS